MKRLGKVIFVVTIISLISKILTFLSGIISLSYFGGDNVYLNIYTYVLSIPNLLFTSLGTVLTTILIPMYTSLLIKKENDRAKKFIDDIITVSLFIVLIIVVVCFTIAPLIISLTKYKNNIEEFDYAVFALRTLLPIMFFFCVNYILVGYLQSHDRFKIASAISLPSSIIIILYQVFLSKKFGITGLIFATLIGYSCQPLILIPSVIKSGYRYKFSLDFKNKDLAEGARLIPAILLGTSAFQINMFFNYTLSTNFETTSVMNNVLNMMLMPVLLIVTSIASIYYPKLSAFWVKNDIDGYKESMVYIIEILAILFIPLTFGIIILKDNIIEIIRWGAFNEKSGLISANILGFYGFGIFFVSMKEILDKALYAQKKTIPSALIGLIMMATNISVSLLLKDSMGTYCLPIAYSISAFVGAICLFFIFIRSSGNLNKSVYINTLKCLLSAIIMGIVVYFINIILKDNITKNSMLYRLIKLLVPTFFGIVIYFVATYFLKVRISIEFFGKFINKLLKRS